PTFSLLAAPPQEVFLPVREVIEQRPRNRLEYCGLARAVRAMNGSDARPQSEATRLVVLYVFKLDRSYLHTLSARCPNRRECCEPAEGGFRSMRKSSFLPHLGFNISPFIRFYHMASTSGNVPRLPARRRRFPPPSHVRAKAATAAITTDTHKRGNRAFLMLSSAGQPLDGPLSL